MVVGGVLPSPFWKLKKNTLILEKISLIVSIYELNFSFKSKFLDLSLKKNRWSFPSRAFFSCVEHEMFSEVPLIMLPTGSKPLTLFRVGVLGLLTDGVQKGPPR